MTLKIESFKENKLIRTNYLKFHKHLFPFLVKTSPILATKYLYRLVLGKKLNLNNPEDFNEKLQWLKLYWQHPLVAKCADKYEMREYVESCGCGEILNELYGVYEDQSEIEWEKFPNKFALKATHGCQFNIICDDKNKLDKNESSSKLKKWLRIDYSLSSAELHYAEIKPKIICEKYIETRAGFLPNDYKIYCFDGKAKLILVATERANDLQLNFLDMNWDRLDIGSSNFNRGDIPSKPNSFDEMVKYAQILSKPFPYVRIDFYEYNDKPLLGEMTFTPAAGVAKYYNDKGLIMLGKLLKLPERYVKE